MPKRMPTVALLTRIVQLVLGVTWLCYHGTPQLRTPGETTETPVGPRRAVWPPGGLRTL